MLQHHLFIIVIHNCQSVYICTIYCNDQGLFAY
jgi:hypothetical protein